MKTFFKYFLASIGIVVGILISFVGISITITGSGSFKLISVGFVIMIVGLLFITFSLMWSSNLLHIPKKLDSKEVSYQQLPTMPNTDREMYYE